MDTLLLYITVCGAALIGVWYLLYKSVKQGEVKQQLEQAKGVLEDVNKAKQVREDIDSLSPDAKRQRLRDSAKK